MTGPTIDNVKHPIEGSLEHTHHQQSGYAATIYTAITVQYTYVLDSSFASPVLAMARRLS